jgi:agmatinase
MAEASHLQPGLAPRLHGDVPSFMGVPVLQTSEDLNGAITVIGMPFDGPATFRGGATRLAPQEIRRFSLLFGGYNLDWDMNAFEYVKVVDSGDVDVVTGDSEESFRKLERQLSAVLRAGAVPVTLGGDHGITYPAVRAVTQHFGEPIGILIFDTHLDLSDDLAGDRFTRASPVKRIAELPEVDPRHIAIVGARGPRNAADWTRLARQLGIRVFGMQDIEERGISSVVQEALSSVSPDGRSLYISVDIDAVDPTFAPATNSPEPGGLTSREIIQALRIAASRGFVGLDVVEVSPDFDTRSGTTAILAARLVCEAICCIAATRRGHKESKEDLNG